ncbi:NADH:ubiquinone oxidoreductase [Thiopseudomonas alkaliphila]|uniref:NADH:ubiquinone oxidoreductase n=1 Tax=Thiopseudomonas alkaliphila TaxID=1697053 RepID=UPI003570E2CF
MRRVWMAIATVLAFLPALAWPQACIIQAQDAHIEVKVCQQNRNIPKQLFEEGFCAPQLQEQEVKVTLTALCPTGAFGVCRGAKVQGVAYQQDVHYYGVASDAAYLKSACEQQSSGVWVDLQSSAAKAYD